MVDIPRPRELTVGLLYRHMGDKLNLKPVDDGTGHSRIVISQDISRPGMALTGYMHKFLHERIQIFGETEISFLLSLSGPDREKAVNRLFQEPVYCSIVTKGLEPPEALVKASRRTSSALFRGKSSSLAKAWINCDLFISSPAKVLSRARCQSLLVISIRSIEK